MARPSSPCKGCENREAGCHAKCESYLSYRKSMDEFNDKVYQAKREEDIKRKKVIHNARDYYKRIYK